MAFDPNTAYSTIVNSYPYFVYFQGGKYYRSTDLVEIPSLPTPDFNGVVMKTITLTQEQYDAIASKDASTQYNIVA